MSDVTFSVSTYLFHQQLLDREHLVDIAAHGFGAVELFALPSHFDCANPEAVAHLSEWLDDTRLVLASVHAPFAEGVRADGWERACSVASSDAATRQRAVTLTLQAIEMASVLPYRHLVVNVGVPDTNASASDNDARAARRSLEEIGGYAADCGVRVALQIMPNRLSTAEALVSLIEEGLEVPGIGICVDVGYARLLGDPVDVIEAASGHILTSHVHDTHGSRAEYLVPYDGSIDWTRTLLAFKKVGFQGPWTFELAPTSTPIATLRAAAHARQRFEQRLGINDELLSQ